MIVAPAQMLLLCRRRDYLLEICNRFYGRAILEDEEM